MSLPSPPSHLLFGILLEERGKNAATEGAIVSVWERGGARPEHTFAQLTTTAHGAIADATPDDALDWINLASQKSDRLTAYDRMASDHLRDFMRNSAFPGLLEHYLEGKGPEGEGEIPLVQRVETQLRNALSFPFSCRVVTLPLSAEGYRDLSAACGWSISPAESAPEPRSQTGTANQAPEQSAPPPMVHFKAAAIVEPTYGLLVDDLHLGDRIGIKITDHTPSARRLGQAFGLVSGVDWLPTWATIQRVELLDTGSLRMHCAVNEHLSVEVTALRSVRVKVDHAVPVVNSAEVRRAFTGVPKGPPVQTMALMVALFAGLVLLLYLGLGATGGA